MTASLPDSNRPVLPESTRTRLLDAAGEVFAESGFRGATVREICARAGVNIALVNYHFGDKLELYTEVLRHSIGASGKGVIKQAIQSTAPPEEAFRELIHAMLQRVCRGDRPGWQFRLMIHELAQPTPAMSAVIDETMKPVYNRFRELIGGMLDLPVDHDKVRLLTHSVIAQVVHYVHARQVVARVWPELELTPERIAQIATHIADFSLAGLRSESNLSTKASSKK
ncbi:MAG TPA: CerR family C-terminal domain-containing protein [Bryobacteraceae bacterium]|nr:CerR family C-terminal domain-containing protein [Bryobacteraceae bacterium]